MSLSAVRHRIYTKRVALVSCACSELIEETVKVGYEGQCKCALLCASCAKSDPWVTAPDIVSQLYKLSAAIQLEVIQETLKVLLHSLLALRAPHSTSGSLSKHALIWTSMIVIHINSFLLLPKNFNLLLS